ncbi:hypothetical protein PGB90_001239 [Kerria lacca]
MVLKFESLFLSVRRMSSVDVTAIESNFNRKLVEPRQKTTILDCGFYKNLPASYKKFYLEWKYTVPKPVHYIPKEGKYYKNPDNGNIEIVQNVPIPLSECPQESEGIWGGEAVIDGFVRLLKGKHRVHDLGPAPRFWFPQLYRSVIYSEILDKYMFCEVTKRAINLINNHYGLDNYLLETKACDLRNILAIKLKRKLLLSLLHKSLYPNDEVKQEEIYNKYKKYLDGYTPEEIEWFGLTLDEAILKLRGIMIYESEQPKIPLKIKFRRDFLKELSEENENQSTIVAEPWYKKKLLSFK